MAAPTRPRNSNPFMAKSPSPSAHRYLGLNVHDFNLTPRNISFPHGSWRDQGRGLRQTHSNIRWCFIGTAGLECPLWVHKRTSGRRGVWSAWCHNQTSGIFGSALSVATRATATRTAALAAAALTKWSQV